MIWKKQLLFSAVPWKCWLPLQAFPEWQRGCRILFSAWNKVEGGWRGLNGSVEPYRGWKKGWTQHSLGRICSSYGSALYISVKNLNIYTFIFLSHSRTPGIEISLYCARCSTNVIFCHKKITLRTWLMPQQVNQTLSTDWLGDACNTASNSLYQSKKYQVKNAFQSLHWKLQSKLIF